MYTNYPTFIGTFIIPVIIAIFAFAFPLLLQTISRIDDKYHSTKLIHTFREDWICLGFVFAMANALIATIIWILQIPRLVDWRIFNTFIDNSALIYIGVSAIVLIIMSFLIVNLTYIYYYPEKLLNHLIKKYNQSQDKKKDYFEAISKILFYSIDKADEPLARTLLEFYFEAFIVFRKGKENPGNHRA